MVKGSTVVGRSRNYKFYCSGTTKEGQPCAFPVHAAGDFCYSHDPKVTPEMRHLRSVKGGKAAKRFDCKRGSPRTPREMLAILSGFVGDYAKKTTEDSVTAEVILVLSSAAKAFAALWDRVNEEDKKEAVETLGWRMKGTG